MRKAIALVISLILLFSGSSIAENISPVTYKQRRETFMSNMGNDIAIFVAPEVTKRNSDIDYKYRANSNIYYLTGFEEPEFAFLLLPGEEHEYIMFVKPNSQRSKMWHGEGIGIEGALDKYGADTAYSIEEFYEILPKYLRNKENLYYNLENKELNTEILPLFDRWNSPKAIVDPGAIMNKMRTFKTKEEIVLIQESINITSNAMKKVAGIIEPGMNESEVAAFIEYNFRLGGSVRNAFPSIVGSGKNSLALHYTKNNCIMNDGDVVCI
ncbi:MAG: Xaa-Pro aminopeptidase, partial [Marinilabiliales bacterium]